MNNLLSYNLESSASVLENIGSACHNYPHHLTQGDYVRHLSYTQTLVRLYAVTLKDTRNLSQSFFGVGIDTFSTNGVIP